MVWASDLSEIVQSAIIWLYYAPGYGLFRCCPVDRAIVFSELGVKT
jgi:hypothetical protein